MNGSVEPGSEQRASRVEAAQAHHGLSGLSEHLLPTLLHDLGNQTQFLMGLRAVLGMQPGGQILRDKADDLARVSNEIEDAGWALALIASAAGADLMLARREPRGLEIAFGLVDNALRRSGSVRPLERRGTWPRLRPNAFPGDAGWQLPWSLATLWWAAGLDATRSDAENESDACYRWELSAVGEAARFEVPAGERTARLEADLLGALPGASLEQDTNGLVLTLPASWLDFEGALA